MIIRSIGQRIQGMNGLGIITDLGTLRGEAVVYVLWDEQREDCANSEWHDTCRARDVVPIAAPAPWAFA